MHIWIVEMKIGDNWESTVGAGITRKDGRRKIAFWKESNPSDQFRLVKYVRANGEYCKQHAKGKK